MEFHNLLLPMLELVYSNKKQCYDPTPGRGVAVERCGSNLPAIQALQKLLHEDLFLDERLRQVVLDESETHSLVQKDCTLWVKYASYTTRWVCRLDPSSL